MSLSVILHWIVDTPNDTTKLITVEVNDMKNVGFKLRVRIRLVFEFFLLYN